MKLFVVAILLSFIFPIWPTWPTWTNLQATSGYKVEAIGALTETKVPENTRQALEPKGLRVLGEKGEPFCEIWFSKSVPTGKGDVAGANFGQFGEGAFIGVINFPANVIDYRSQGIKPGYYTLRYGLILQDGNHLGVSVHRDFLLACPIAEDKDPAAQLKLEDLYQLSRGSSGTGHPSVWSLVPVDSKEGLPKVIKDPSEHVILQTMVGNQAIGLVVVGKAES